MPGRDATAPPGRLVAPWTWWAARDPLRNFPYELLIVTLLLGVLLAAFDVVVSDLPSPVAEWERTADPRGRQLLDALLGFTGVPSILLLTIVSLAVPSLSPAIASSLPLVFRAYPVWRVSAGVCALTVAASVLLVLLWLLTRVGWTTPAEWWRDAHVLVGLGAAVLLGIAAVSLYLVLRANAIQRPLVLAGALVAGVAISNGVHELVLLPQQHLLTAAIVGGIVVLQAAYLVAAVIWLLRLRHPTELVQALLQMGTNVIDYVERSPRLRAAQDAVLPDYVECAYEEQEEFKQIVHALAQIAMHSLHQDSPHYARAAIGALFELQQAAMSLDARTADWLVVRSFDGTRQGDAAKGWVDAICVEGLAAALYASAEEHYESVGNVAAERLGDIVSTRIRDDTERHAVLEPTTLRTETVTAVLTVLSNAFHECVQFDESELGDDVLDSFGHTIEQLQETRAGEWVAVLTTPDAVKTKLEELVVNAGRRCASQDDVPALRALLQTLRFLREGEDEALRRGLVKAVIGLGAAALAARSYACASILIDWVERLGVRDVEAPAERRDREGRGDDDDLVRRAPDPDLLATCASECVERERIDRSQRHPLPATHTYMLVFTALAITRIVVSWPGWELRRLESVRATILADAFGGGQRVAVAAQRLVAAVPYPREERERWELTIRRWLQV